jgi:hypothetical protein
VDVGTDRHISEGRRTVANVAWGVPHYEHDR